jgi:hypothetical protein
LATTTLTELGTTVVVVVDDPLWPALVEVVCPALVVVVVEAGA